MFSRLPCFGTCFSFFLSFSGCVLKVFKSSGRAGEEEMEFLLITSSRFLAKVTTCFILLLYLLFCGSLTTTGEFLCFFWFVKSFQICDLYLFLVCDVGFVSVEGPFFGFILMAFLPCMVVVFGE